MRLLLCLAVSAVVSALQYGNRRHFLLVHGSGTSASAFENSPTAAGAKLFLAGVPRRQDANSALVPANWQYSAPDAGTADGSWWQGDGVGLDLSVERIEAIIAARPEISGIIGHEQGGTVAAIVAARAALKEGPRPLDFAVICGAHAHWLVCTYSTGCETHPTRQYARFTAFPKLTRSIRNRVRRWLRALASRQRSCGTTVVAQCLIEPGGRSLWPFLTAQLGRSAMSTSTMLGDSS